MLERICAACQTGNSVDALSCRECGVPLSQPLARRPSAALARHLPAVPARWQRAGKAVALGAATLAVEVGAAWLQHRANARPAPLARRQPTPTPARPLRGLVVRRRVWETYSGGQLTDRVMEQTFWHLDEDR